MPQRWDIFCRVVDNFGDAGVCWRLARQLAHEHGFQVRLWIDDLASLARLEPAVVTARHQGVAGVEVLQWDAHADAGVVAGGPADVVIESFGCGLPAQYIAAMAQQSRGCVWIVLEYLSAEPWVREHHGLPSPHPRLPLQRYFFFPGFVPGTGGLLRERDLFSRRAGFDARAVDAFWRSVGHEPLRAGATAISIFGYESAPLAELLQVWESGSASIVAAIPEGRSIAAALAHFGADRVPPARVLRRGALEVRILPFVPQVGYDELLWSCDVNFVRGEDSFVRAQWAGRPLVWQIYPQEARAHWEKLDAFLDLYSAGLPAEAAMAVAALMRFWNRTGPGSAAASHVWATFAAERAALRRHAHAWVERIAAHGDLADNLARFCLNKLK